MDLSPTDKRLLQRRTNLHRLHSIGQLNRQLRIIQTRISKLLRLFHKRHLEPSVIMRRHLARYTARVIVIHEILLGIGIH